MMRPEPIWRLIVATSMLCCLHACSSTSGLINKVNRGNEVFENSCERFQAEVKTVLEANRQSGILPVSEYENSAYDYFYLEPGQFEIRGDTLLFRLKQDLDYSSFVDGDIAIHVELDFKAPEPLKELMIPSQGQLGTIVIDRGYYLRHSRPFFRYMIPLHGIPLAGRQLFLSFGIVEYDKGVVKQVFCESEQVALGKAEPACCAAEVWKNCLLQSVVNIPPLPVAPDTFAYAGFRATMDISFQKGAYEVPLSLPARSLQSMLQRMESRDFKASRIVLTSYPAIEGDAEAQAKKARELADATRLAIETLNGSSGLNVETRVEGPDWERVGNLVQTSQSLNGTQKDAVLEIIRKETGDASKLIRLGLLDFHETLQREVFSQSQHIRATIRFDYTGTYPTLGRYPEVLSLWDERVEGQVARLFAIHPYHPGVDIASTVEQIDQILAQKASANVYAMRATYMEAARDYPAAIANLEQAAALDPANETYPEAIRAYRIRFARTYDLDERLRMLKEYDRLVAARPSDRQLFFNRAILMDQCGLTARALLEYEKLFEAANISPAQRNNRGVARLKGFHLRDARLDFEQALAENPNLAEPHFNLAVLNAYEGHERACVEHLDQAIRLDGRYKDMIFNNPAFSVLASTPRFRKYRSED